MMRVLAVVAASVLVGAGGRKAKCRNQHSECDSWALVGECDKNPSYMHESCAVACGTCGVRTDALGFAVDLFGAEMTDDDRGTFANNARINNDQPRMVPKFTDVGFSVVPIPGAVFARLVAERDRRLAQGRGGAAREGCTRGYLNNCGATPTLRIDVSSRLKSDVSAAVQGVLEAWIGPEWGGLVPTAVYGIRRYGNGSTLQAHVDVVATHAVSAILNVGQDVDEDWPLHILDHAGARHDVVMRPGEMVLYESSKNIHGRMVPLRGRSYDNIFVHFRPRRGWDRFLGVPNGAVASDHVEL